MMSNLVSYFSKKYDVVLVNDFILDDSQKIYTIPDSVKRVYLRKELSGNPIKKNIDRIMALRKAVKAENPDVVLSFLGNPNKRLLLATVGLNCRIIVSVRNDPQHEYGSGKFARWIARRLFNLADGVVFQTTDAADYFQESVREKSAVILNPVADQFYKVQKTEKPENIITVGRFEKQKNHKLLIEAWGNIEKDFPDDKLIIYGDGPLRTDYEKLIEELNLEDRVELPGVVTDVAEKLAEAKLFVLSSDFEGLPNALMEAMAVGVPCISTDCPCGGPRQLIQNEIDGILIQCKDIYGLSMKMRLLLNSNEKLDSIGMHGKEKAKGFHSSVIFEKWEAYLSEC